MFYAKNVIRRMSRSISSHFGAIHCQNMCPSRKSPKNLLELLESRRSGLELLKFAFNAENFVAKLSWSISSHFVEIQC